VNARGEMIFVRSWKARLITGLIMLVLAPWPAFACSACFGKSDSAMAQGMNWGIFSLLGIIVSVLGSVAVFFVYLGKRSAALQASGHSAPTASPEHASPRAESATTGG